MWKTEAAAEGAGVFLHALSVRRLEAGELRMEVWIEEAKAKFAQIQAAEKAADGSEE